MKNLKKLSILIITFLIIFSSQAQAAKVVIDPGHGGKDPGAIGVNELYEKTAALNISLKLQAELISRGYEVVLTRSDDSTLSLQERVEFKEAQKADLFISIHANSFHNSTAKGSLVLYYDSSRPNKNYPASSAMTALSSTNKIFAQSVLTGLLEASGTQDRGIVPHSAYVIRKGSIPSILVETAFLSNWEDAAKLSNEDDRLKMAVGIANGIENFMPASGFKDIAGHWAQASIMRLKEQGIVLGANDTFSPDRTLTRAEFLTLMDRVFDFEREEEVLNEILEEENLEEEVVEEVVEEVSTIEKKHPENKFAKRFLIAPSNLPSFMDLDLNHWAFPTLEKAYTYGFIQGYPDGSIRPNQSITRAEVSVFFDRMWKQETDQNQLAEDSFVYDDVPSHLWFAPSVHRLKDASIIEFISGNTFTPDRFMNRAEIAVMIDSYLEHYGVK